MICMIQQVFPGLDLYYTDPAQPLATAGEDLLIDYLDHDLFVRAVENGPNIIDDYMIGKWLMLLALL